ncbi:hypothetical protein PIB30_035174 [Stylosanthes scabra]|uniref:Uncharacterized protein n=1 Tax=Stylosanthes scabra TaxID=79078 RepID=A0ABU6YD93_9FABA|nr:hypothetical protein [Stylosanthes scabra]
MEPPSPSPSNHRAAADPRRKKTQIRDKFPSSSAVNFELQVAGMHGRNLAAGEERRHHHFGMNRRRRSLTPPRLFCFQPQVAGNPPTLPVTAGVHRKQQLPPLHVGTGTAAATAYSHQGYCPIYLESRVK